MKLGPLETTGRQVSSHGMSIFMRSGSCGLMRVYSMYTRLVLFMPTVERWAVGEQSVKRARI